MVNEDERLRGGGPEIIVVKVGGLCTAHKVEVIVRWFGDVIRHAVGGLVALHDSLMPVAVATEQVPLANENILF